MNSHVNYMLSLALCNKVYDRRKAKPLSKFKDILGERTLNEEEVVQVS